jgi:hypothetical protein
MRRGGGRKFMNTCIGQMKTDKEKKEEGKD